MFYEATVRILFSLNLIGIRRKCDRYLTGTWHCNFKQLNQAAMA